MTRVHKDRYDADFTIVKNHPLQDPALSLKAKGTFAYLWSLPDDWDFHEAEIVNHATDGQRSLNTAVKELRVNGYIEIKREHTGHTDWVLHEIPQSNPQPPQHKPKVPQRPKPRPHVRNAHMRNAHVYKGLTKQRTVPDSNEKPKIMNQLTTCFNVSNLYLGVYSDTVDEWLKKYPANYITELIHKANVQQCKRGKIRRPLSYIKVMIDANNKRKQHDPQRNDDNFGSIDDIKKREQENERQAVARLKNGEVQHLNI